MKKKLFKNLQCKWNVLAIALVAMMSVTLASCGSDEKEDPIDVIVDKYDVAGTTWGYSVSYADGVSESIELKFSAASAIMTHRQTVNNQTLSETYNYSYKRSDNLIFLTPMESGRPSLEGEIVNTMKMVVTNTLNKATMDFYKQ